MIRRLMRVFGAAAVVALVGVGVGTTGFTPTSAASMPLVDTKSAGLRVGLNALFQEHVYLAAMATGTALQGRTDDFKVAADTRRQPGRHLQGHRFVYGTGAEQAFLPLWRKHIGFFVDHTTGVATKDKTKSDKAIGDLLQYTKDFGAFLSSANPNLPKDGVAELVKEHALTLKAVVDAQAANDPAKADAALRMAGAHMQMIADPLAAAIVKQFPEKF